MLFNISINNLDDESEYTHIKFADDTKLDGAVNIQKGSAAIQKDLDRLEEQVDRNLMKFSKGKHKVLRLGQSTLSAAVLAEHCVVEEQHCRKLVDKLNMSQTL